MPFLAAAADDSAFAIAAFLWVMGVLSVWRFRRDVIATSLHYMLVPTYLTFRLVLPESDALWTRFRSTRVDLRAEDKVL